ncbi:MAG: DUF1294 domain-containing protein [Oscillospiraceae bacterium]|nr:DUF1294 domain-containing protein [Oscillospiraceae bacterium]
MIAFYLLFVNLVGFAVMGIDKRRAKKNKWRVKEKSIFTTAFLGGALGAWLGMSVFRHKTKHKQFKYGLPAICIAQWAVIAFLIWRGSR